MSDADLDFLLKNNWTQRKDGYVVRGKRLKGKYNLFYLHREIYKRSGMKPMLDEGMMVDHIDRDQLNNTRENLRVVNAQQSAYNRGGSKTFKGVTKVDAGWAANIQSQGRKIYLGTFPSERIAAGIYNKAAVSLHGEYAALNELNESDGKDSSEIDKGT